MSASALRVAGSVLNVVKGALGCSVETVQITTEADGWVEIVVADDEFGGTFDAQRLAGAICAVFAGKMRYAGPVAHEGGVVTITLTRAEDGIAELRVSEGP